MDLETEAAQRVGTTLCNKWTLERLIGTGGMAAVYVAAHKIGRREAIKILHSDVARDPELRARFEQEANAVNRFKHPGTVEVRDIDVAEDGSPFLVMELLDGQSLAELARAGAIELGQLLRWVDELLDVLAAAHAQGIIHRDIKPDNLFVLRDGRLKVLDFGIARVRAGVPSKLKTRAGATLGTAPYMPPEQIRGQEIDARADLFAVGATMFRLVARRRIHEASSESEMLVRMASTPAPSLGSVAPDAPRDLCMVVDRALMFDREHRYPDAITMQGDVRAVREGRPPLYANARLAALAAGGAPPSVDPATRAAASVVVPSAAISSDALTRGAVAALGTEQTALAGHVGGDPQTPGPAGFDGGDPQTPGPAGAAPRVERTAAASPTALHGTPQALAMGETPKPPPQAFAIGEAQQARPVLESDAVTTQKPPGAVEASMVEPPTRPAMMVLGAAGIGAPLASTPAGAAATAAAVAALPPPPPASALPKPAAAAAPDAGPPQAPGERTMRSVLGPEGQGYAVAPQGIAVSPPAPPALTPTPVSPGGPRTQLSGVAPPTPPPPAVAPAAPGESIPVVPAPPIPKRRHTLPGTEISIWPLVGVGVVFAAIGVAITLWLMLRGPDPADMATYQIPTSAPTVTSRSTPHGPATSIGPSLGPTKGPVRPHRP